MKSPGGATRAESGNVGVRVDISELAAPTAYEEAISVNSRAQQKNEGTGDMNNDPANKNEEATSEEDIDE
ncbi:hypothetical protein U1Q18_009798, partial [Sarracenia purpurea var. burkii]